MKNKGKTMTNREAPKKKYSAVLKFLLPLLIVAAAVAGACAMIATAPKPQKAKPKRVLPLVTTAPAQLKGYQVWLPIMGTVTAAKEVTIGSQVSGRVQSVTPHFKPGGHVSEGELLVQIEREEYELAVNEAKSTVAEARYDLRVEEGYQNVAKKEWAVLGTKPATSKEAELALRKPHLLKAQAALAAAEATLRDACLNLERTTIKAPFAAIVQEKNVDVGSTLSTNDTVATLVGTDEFWVEASIASDRLGWVAIPRQGHENDGSPVRITVKSGGQTYTRTGRVTSLLPSLETDSRMARVLITVKDPLNMKGEKDTPPLLLGTYVRARIQSRELDDVVVIPRTALHDDSSVWILGEGNKLEIRKVDPVWKDVSNVVVRNQIKPGESIITSDLSAPVHGMTVQVAAGGPDEG
jgi:RND family efflux transporter MFP subunit